MIYGVNRVATSPLTKDDGNAVPTYGSVTDCGDGNIAEFDYKPKYNSGSAYGSNRQVAADTEYASAEVDLELNDFPADLKVAILGALKSSDGGAIGTDSDYSPDLAVLYKAPLRKAVGDSKHGFRYGVIYDVTFVEGDYAHKTLEGKPAYTAENKLTGTALPLKYTITDSQGHKRHLVEYHIDKPDESLDDTWFSKVTVPTIASASNTASASGTTN